MLDKLCKQGIEILKQTHTRRSAQSLYDVFYMLWAEGYFDGYGMEEKVIPENRDEFAEIFVQHGNSEMYDEVKKWYKANYGTRKPSSTAPTMVTVGVGDLLKESDKAYCFHSGKYTNGRYGLEPVGIWVPKSQVEWNGHSELRMPVWLAVEKNYMRTN